MGGDLGLAWGGTGTDLATIITMPEVDPESVTIFLTWTRQASVQKKKRAPTADVDELQHKMMNFQSC